jgi:hypothetical protein
MPRTTAKTRTDDENAKYVFDAIVNAYDNGFAVLDLDDEQLAIDLNRYDQKCGWFTHRYLLDLLKIVRPMLKVAGYVGRANHTT